MAVSNADRQKAHAARHGVGWGWYVYRENATQDRSPYLAGTPGWDLPQWRFILVEEALLRSCLPRVEVEPFQDQLERSELENKSAAAAARAIGAVRSGSLHCVQP
jgi:hypothetical protein